MRSFWNRFLPHTTAPTLRSIPAANGFEWQQCSSDANFSEAERDNKALVLTAVGLHGICLEHASEMTQSDREIVLAAVRQDSCSLEYAGKSWKRTQDRACGGASERGKYGGTKSVSPFRSRDGRATTRKVIGPDSEGVLRILREAVLVRSGLSMGQSLASVSPAHLERLLCQTSHNKHQWEGVALAWLSNFSTSQLFQRNHCASTVAAPTSAPVPRLCTEETATEWQARKEQ